MAFTISLMDVSRPPGVSSRISRAAAPGATRVLYGLGDKLCSRRADDPVYFDLVNCFCEGGGFDGFAGGGGAEPR